jgi:DNA-binding NtrC family response regulator
MASVLIVDDNVDLAENIAEILEMDGHSTRVAPSAEDALRMEASSVSDVLVTDYRLPGLTGVQFVRQIKEIRAGVRAIVISAYTDDGTMKEARDAGATFMAKPVDYAALGRWVRGGSA